MVNSRFMRVKSLYKYIGAKIGLRDREEAFFHCWCRQISISTYIREALISWNRVNSERDSTPEEERRAKAYMERMAKKKERKVVTNVVEETTYQGKEEVN